MSIPVAPVQDLMLAPSRCAKGTNLCKLCARLGPQTVIDTDSRNPVCSELRAGQFKQRGGIAAAGHGDTKFFGKVRS